MLREKLAGFVGTLFEPAPYSERPMFRGFYLTGAIGADAPKPAPAEAQRKWGPSIAPVEEPAKAGKSFSWSASSPR